jgi:translation elongation factor EF-1beta
MALFLLILQLPHHAVVIQPWDDETDMVKLEECVRSVEADGLLWGASKLVAVGYGIKKLQIRYHLYEHMDMLCH